MTDVEPPPKTIRVRRVVLVIYVVVGALALCGAMLALSSLLIPERGIAIVPSEPR